MTEQAQKTDGPELTPFESSLIRDFYLSFRHSQGNPELQGYITLYAARKYDPNGVGDPDKLKEKLDPVVESMNIPNRHTKQIVSPEEDKMGVLDHKAAQTNTSGFQIQWYRFIATLNRVFLDKPDPRKTLYNFDKELYEESLWSENRLLAEILVRMIGRDYHYQSKDRPNRKREDDEHESFLKKHMIDGKSTGSTVYDMLYKDLRKLTGEVGLKILDQKANLAKELDIPDELAMGVKDGLVKLADRWEIKHYGEKFYNGS